jgi:hypothetical protein
MTKTPTKTARAAAPKADATKTTDLPLIEKEAEPQTVHVGVFNPNLLAMPTTAELSAILFCMGFQTAPIFGQDKDGNLVNEAGGIIIPSQLRKFFNLAPAQIVKQPAAEGPNK